MLVLQADDRADEVIEYRLSLRTYWSHPTTAADVLALGKQVGALLSAADDERQQAKRNSLADKLTVAAKTLVKPEVEKALVESKRRKVEGDLRPVKYVATLLGADNETVLRWFILVVALLLDPAAVLLLLAATRTRP
jgi:hypothetical protein